MNRQFSYGSSSTTSEQIRQEIQRFESVHPCIYAIYDLVDSIPDLALANHIRENVVCIEDSFVNSQEWTLSRAAPDLKLGVVGSLSSGKSALVHRYLTGSYMQEESPEGGRFKKEVVLDGQPYLLLIRDEGGPPEQQFTHWVDAVMFVFSLENETSFNAVYNYYAKMAHYRNTADIPMILVGTQDSISETNPRVIDENRARKLANDLKRCNYFETCATYGLNVERVFRDACVKIIQQRLQLSQQQCQNSNASSSTIVAPPPSSCPSTPSHQTAHHNNQLQRQFNFYSPSPIAVQSTSALPGLLANNSTNSSAVVSSTSNNHHHHHHPSPLQTNNSLNAVVFRTDHHQNQHQSNGGTSTNQLPTSPIRKQQQGGGASSVSSSDSPSFTMLGISPATSNHSVSSLHQWSNQQHSHSTPCGAFAKDQQEFKHPANFVNNVSQSNRSSNLSATNLDPSLVDAANQLPTPSSTPTTQRKNRRISNIFNRKDDDKTKFSISNDAGGIGVGRAIPVKQGNLCKKSSKTLNKEWKKKYVCLFHDGRLTYYPSLRDYMDDAHGKEIYLGHTTVKVPGQRPRCSQQQRSLTQPIMTNGLTKENAKINGNKVLLTSFEAIREGKASTSVASSFDASFLSSNLQGNGADDSRVETPNLKKKDKKHLRKSSQIKNGDLDDSDNYEFIVVSINNKQWHFEAENSEEREQWVQAIEQQILSSLQSNSSNKSGSARAHGDRSAVQALRNIPGNSHCADCGFPNPDWASLNLGALICIECCGVHRNLGTHISKVRSLDLDEWPVECLNVMHAIGNKVANGVWEFNTKGRLKPTPNSSRDVKSAWIRSKYETREFLCPLPSSSSTLVEQIGETICKKDLRAVILLLAHCKSTSQINCTIGARDLRTPLHLACAVGSPTIAQLLIWYNADVKAVDHDGRSPLWYAKNSGSQECVDVLIHNGCPSDFLQQSLTTPVSRKNHTTLPSDNLTATSKCKTCNDAFDKLPASVI